MNFPASSRFVKSDMPTPSCQSSSTGPPLRSRKQKTSPIWDRVRDLAGLGAPALLWGRLRLPCRTMGHAALHIRHPAGDPNVHTRRNGDHRPSVTGSSRANASGSTSTGTTRRRPFPGTISNLFSGHRRPGRLDGRGRRRSRNRDLREHRHAHRPAFTTAKSPPRCRRQGPEDPVASRRGAGLAMPDEGSAPTCGVGAPTFGEVRA